MRALVLSGGGARAAYQAGVLGYVADAFPDADLPVITGISAGAINAAHLANRDGSFRVGGRGLVGCWEAIRTDRVFEADSRMGLLMRLVRWVRSEADEESPRALFDTSPLRAFLRERLPAPEGRLDGVDKNLASGRLRAVALAATNYATGQTVNWIQGGAIETWERANRISVSTALTVDHVMASASLPLLFPAVQVGGAWYGDGGLRFSAPLSPAIHLGANRLLVISTRYNRSRAEADTPVVHGYPPAAQVVGMLLNAIFLDVLDQDAHVMRLINKLVEELPRHRRHGLRPVRLLQLRPSVDLGRIAGDFEMPPPPPFGLLMRALDSDATTSPDWLSMLLFEPGYVERLLELGYADARRQHDALASFFDD